MRALLCAFVIAAGAAAMSSPAHAQNYPWCAYYGGNFGGTNCGFSSFAQCQATIRGIGGECMRNTQYRGRMGYRPY